jgi:hypothetical protein
MIPEERLSTTLVYSALVVPNPQPEFLVSRQLGGVGIQDPSQGLQVKIWTCALEGDNVVLYADDVAPVTIFTRADISQLSLAFDQNMRPFIAFVEAGVAKFYWYDSLIEDFRFSDLPAGSTFPRATLDDHRENQLDTSDIILAYIDDGNLYFRAQRDRFQTQYLLYADINLDLIAPQLVSIGMDLNWRLQFHLRGSFYGSS